MLCPYDVLEHLVARFRDLIGHPSPVRKVLGEDGRDSGEASDLLSSMSGEKMNHPNTPMAAHLWDTAKTNAYAMNMEPPITFLGLLLKGNCTSMLSLDFVVSSKTAKR
jgi:hypothetical protein